MLKGLHNAMKILIVEDDREISKLLSNFLVENEYEIVQAFDGREASNKLKNEFYDLVLMDMMLPYKGGDTLIKELREHSNTPVIVLSAKSMKETRLEVLRLGADDYIMKPFDLDEVLVRIEVVLRRSGAQEHANKDAETEALKVVFSFGTVSYSAEKHQAFFDNHVLNLTAKELLLLEQFLKHPDTTFTKAHLYEVVWQDTYYCEDNTMNVHVSNLRSKLKKASGHDLIDTVWGIGYRLKKDA